MAWVILSMSEISGHNHNSLYGNVTPYSKWNIVVIFSDLLD
jgi:hypothetical protein